MHHAIMNVLEPIFDRPMIYHSYACRKGKGTHAAVLYVFRQCKANSCFLKLDVRKYFLGLPAEGDERKNSKLSVQKKRPAH